jgi:hypothetical protein
MDLHQRLDISAHSSLTVQLICFLRWPLFHYISRLRGRNLAHNPLKSIGERRDVVGRTVSVYILHCTVASGEIPFRVIDVVKVYCDNVGQF